MTHRWITAISLLLAVATWSTKAHAEELPAELSVDQAVQEAVNSNLALLAERYNLSLAEARLISAQLRPNPVFSFGSDYQDWLGAGFTPARNLGPAEVDFRTDFIIEARDKRKSRIEVAETSRQVTRLQFLNTTRLLVLDVQNGCVDVLAAKNNLSLAQENLKVFNELVEINAAKVRVGELAEVELVRSKVAALQYRNSVLQAELHLRTSLNRLRTLIGRPLSSAPIDLAGELRRDSLSVSLEDLQKQALSLRPDLQGLKKDEARSVAEIRSQIAQGRVDYTVGAEWHRQYGDATPSPGNSLGVFFSLPLPVFNRNQGEIERARVEQQQILGRIRALEADLHQEVSTALQQYQTAQDLLSNIEKEMLQQAREVRETTEYSYRRGEASLVELLDAQHAFNDTMQSYNDARAEYARSLYLIDSISGRTVTP